MISVMIKPDGSQRVSLGYGGKSYALLTGVIGQQG